MKKIFHLIFLLFISSLTNAQLWKSNLLIEELSYTNKVAISNWKKKLFQRNLMLLRKRGRSYVRIVGFAGGFPGRGQEPENRGQFQEARKAAFAGIA